MEDHGAHHIPVLLNEVLTGLNLPPGAAILDGTLGAGGHSEAILEATAPNGTVLGFDRDDSALATARSRLARFGERLTTVHASYAQMKQLGPARCVTAVDGILLDLGYSSLQIDDPARGFSFREGGPLDMRFDRTQHLTAEAIVNRFSEADLVEIIFRYGEDRHARRIVRGILAARPIRDTAHLAEVIAASVPRSKEKIHPATRTFQALRIAVNDELGEVERALPETLDLLRPGGRLAVISFHSLEDRIVKQFMKRESLDCICPPEQPICTCDHHAALKLITRKPIIASDAEITANPRARSAKLRVAERV